jgi:hypothetical protein
MTCLDRLNFGLGEQLALISHDADAFTTENQFHAGWNVIYRHTRPVCRLAVIRNAFNIRQLGGSAEFLLKARRA